MKAKNYSMVKQQRGNVSVLYDVFLYDDNFESLIRRAIWFVKVGKTVHHAKQNQDFHRMDSFNYISTSYFYLCGAPSGARRLASIDPISTAVVGDPRECEWEDTGLTSSWSTGCCASCAAASCCCAGG